MSGDLAYRPRRCTTAIVLHDTHTPASLNASHPFLLVHGRSLGLLTVGYHFVIERDGFVQSYRGDNLVGSHTPGRNHDTVGIALMGGLGVDGEPEDNFTADQTYSLKHLVRGIRFNYGEIPLLGHGELHHRAKCPCVDMEEVRGLCK